MPIKIIKPSKLEVFGPRGTGPSHRMTRSSTPLGRGPVERGLSRPRETGFAPPRRAGSMTVRRCLRTWYAVIDTDLSGFVRLRRTALTASDVPAVPDRILKVQSQEKTVFPFDFFLFLFDFASKTPCNLLFSFF